MTYLNKACEVLFGAQNGLYWGAFYFDFDHCGVTKQSTVAASNLPVNRSINIPTPA